MNGKVKNFVGLLGMYQFSHIKNVKECGKCFELEYLIDLKTI